MKEPILSVAILKAEEINFELYGDYYLSDENQKINGKFIARIDKGKVKISQTNKVINHSEEILFSYSNLGTDSFLIRDVVIGIQFHWQQKENQRFQGSLKFIIEENKITAINLIPLENYLTSVISSEMSATSSDELLKAHSIISRGWVLAQVDKNKTIQKEKLHYSTTSETEDELIKWYDREEHKNYDVCADDHCQRYQGITRLFAHKAQNAVAFTRGLVLMYDNKICDTRFSKSCGGVSEAFENVWEPVKHEYLQSVVDNQYDPENFDLDLRNEKSAEKWIKGNPPAFCNTADEKVLKQVLVSYDRETKDFYRWKVEYEQEKLSEILNRKSGKDFGKIIDLIPVERGASGRLIKLKIIGTKKTLIIGKELEIRRVLSETHLYSSAFIVEKENIIEGIPQRFIFRGAGWGHGVGLCQIGAAVMSEKGYNFDEILLHYFRGAKIQKYYK
jgi:SpoIID/LytB domain protein